MFIDLIYIKEGWADFNRLLHVDQKRSLKPTYNETNIFVRLKVNETFLRL